MLEAADLNTCGLAIWLAMGKSILIQQEWQGDGPLTPENTMELGAQVRVSCLAVVTRLQQRFLNLRQFLNIRKTHQQTDRGRRR